MLVLGVVAFPHVIEYVKEKKSLSGYDGIMYMPDEFILDVDGSNPENALEKLQGLLLLLEDLDVTNQGNIFEKDFSSIVEIKASIIPSGISEPSLKSIAGFVIR